MLIIQLSNGYLNTSIYKRIDKYIIMDNFAVDKKTSIVNMSKRHTRKQ